MHLTYKDLATRQEPLRKSSERSWGERFCVWYQQNNINQRHSEPAVWSHHFEYHDIFDKNCNYDINGINECCIQVTVLLAMPGHAALGSARRLDRTSLRLSSPSCGQNPAWLSGCVIAVESDPRRSQYAEYAVYAKYGTHYVTHMQNMLLGLWGPQCLPNGPHRSQFRMWAPFPAQKERSINSLISLQTYSVQSHSPLRRGLVRQKLTRTAEIHLKDERQLSHNGRVYRIFPISNDASYFVSTIGPLREQ